MKLLTLCALFCASICISNAGNNIICYFTSWTTYRPGNGKFTALDIDPSLCTHILYGFVGLGWDYKVQILDDWEANGLHEFQNLHSLKEKNPNLKILISMGGWNEGSQKYSVMAADPVKRQTLTNDIVAFLEKNNFDGFDLDWEYPAQRDSSNKDDVENYVTLLKELKAALAPRGWLLSAAVAGGIPSINQSYIIPEVSEALDLINVMTYDYHGAFDNYVGHSAPLYASTLDPTDELKGFNVATGIQYWIDQGADLNKLNLGVGTYGRTFTLADPTNTSLYAPVIGQGGNAGPYTRQAGVLGYNEICELCSNWTRVWDPEQKVPHIYSGNQWVGYDDEESLTLKVNLAKEKQLGGIMVWSLDTDDFRGICGEKYPLVKTVYNVLNS